MKIKSLLENIFSVKNEYANDKNYKVIKVLGFKIKLKKKCKCESGFTLYNNVFIPKEGIFYKFNPEYGIGNLEIKFKEGKSI